MTNSSPTHAKPSPRERRLTCRVSSLSIICPDRAGNEQASSSEGEPSPKGTPERRRRSASAHLTRQVSHDGLTSFSEKKNGEKQSASDSGRSSPVRCVSEFDKVTSVVLKRKDNDDLQAKTIVPRLPNPLHNRGMFAQHAQSLRLEAELQPMRLILSRLMANLTYNRKGIFNAPVDPVALGLADYFNVIKQPMDLGTVKNRLHSVAYLSRQEVVENIRLCFRNAMTYNPPHHIVHISAKELLSCFEEQLESFCPELAISALSGDDTTAPLDNARKQPPGEESSFLGVNSACTVSAAQLGAECQSPPSGASSVSNSFQLNSSPECTFAVASANTLSTRKSDHREVFLAPSVVSMTARKRKKRGSKAKLGHNCQWCHGNVCAICDQGCLPLEPTLLICNGPHCAGAKVRKGAIYYIAPDGSCQYCQRCYSGLPAMLPQSGKYEDVEVCRYKRDLLKRKNVEEVVEHWVTCAKCLSAIHRICVMHNPYVHREKHYLCPSCVDHGDAVPVSPRELHSRKTSEMFTFVAGSELPVPISNIASGKFLMGEDVLSADVLEVTPMSSFIEQKVRSRMVLDHCPNAEKTVVIRIISDCLRSFNVPEAVRKHFHMQSQGETGVIPPSRVPFRSKAIALFQKIDGLDVCIFCMYVQEYDGDDVFEDAIDSACSSQQKRVYIAYLDSVEHFRPRTCRTEVYQEILTAYLATARLRGYEAAHIWACPPSRGNSFVFWNHPEAQRTPNMERLTAWYYSAISRAVDCGVVCGVQSLYESDFEESMQQIEANAVSDKSTYKMTCPPLLEGDFWIEEAVRIHSTTLARHSKDKFVPVNSALTSVLVYDQHDPCPAIQIAAMLRDKIIAHPSSAAFRRPVNAAAMNLKDYHVIVSKPMDLGTVHSRCVLGEYQTLSELVADVNLIFSNAKKFNPSEHVVHFQAIELGDLFFYELNRTTRAWVEPFRSSQIEHTWQVFADMSMGLGTTLNYGDGLALVEGPYIDNSAAMVTTSTVPLSSNHKSCASSRSVRIASSDSACSDQRSVYIRQGSDAIHQQMVGRDVWLLDKKNPVPPKGSGFSKTKRRKSSVDSIDEPVPKRRRQTWLGEEVGAAVRRMRTSFFKCSLVPDSLKVDRKLQKLDSFEEYSQTYKVDDDRSFRSSRVADARHALLEFSQFRTLEFDTLRRAKYSSAMLLYHLHDEKAPGLIPECTSCHQEIEGVRWHRINKVLECRPSAAFPLSGRKPKTGSSFPVESEELCLSCYSKHANQDQFIPLQVSL